MSGTEVPERVLMDDEEIVRAVAGDLLQALGHEVALVAEGEAALRAYREAQQASLLA